MRKTLLSIFTLVAMNTIAQDCSDLFISEYVEGPAQNNAIEIYNPTSSSIDLSGYSINRYSNGATSASEVWPLSGAIAAGQAIAIGNGQLDSIWVSTYWSTPVDPVFYTACGMHCSGIYPTPFYFNGDDALTLEKGTAIIDIFGKVGEDPGGAWTDDASAGYTDANGGDWWTKRQTLIRKPSVKKGVSQNPILFNPTLQYDSLPDATYTGMGSHTCDCTGSTAITENNEVSYVMYPNPANSGVEVSVNSSTLVKNIRLTNILGEQVRFNQSINTSALAKGTYVVDIEFANGKFVKNKLIIE